MAGHLEMGEQPLGYAVFLFAYQQKNMMYVEKTSTWSPFCCEVVIEYIECFAKKTQN